MSQDIRSTITRLLAAQEPCTLEEILEEVRIQCGINRNRALPETITAIAALQSTGAICEYEQTPLDDPLEYAWLLSEDSD